MLSLTSLVLMASSVLGQAAAQEDAAKPELLTDDYIVGTWIHEGVVHSCCSNRKAAP